MLNTQSAQSNQLPLDVVLQQCHDEEHLSPTRDEAAWLACLQEVYVSFNYGPTVAQFGDAIQTVWAQELSKQTFADALANFRDASGQPAFSAAAVADEVARFYLSTCLVLDGNSVVQSFVKCGNGPVLRFEGKAPYTLIIWIKFNNLFGGNLMGRIVGSGWSGMPPVSGGYLLMNMGGSLRSYRYASPYFCDGAANLTTNVRYCIAATFDGAVSRVYLDGAEKGSAGYGAPMVSPVPETEFLIGCTNRGSPSIYGNSLSASIARAAVYGAALGPAALAPLVAGKPAAGDADLAAFWDFSTGSARDLSGCGNDGQLVGNAKFAEGY